MATPIKKSNPLSDSVTAAKVRVALRVRPFLPSETDRNGSTSISCVTLLDRSDSKGEVTVLLKDQFSSRNEVYKLDSFYEQGDRVDQIFSREVNEVIPGIFNGCNATVFAYGATGSGKTYTMQGTEDEPGLIPLSLATIFSICKEEGSLVEVSYFEIYMEKCFDLLEPKAKEIMTLDDKDGQLQLKGLSWIPVCSMDEFSEIYSVGVQRRKVAHTGLNDISSRSHAVLAIAIASGSVKGKLNLIDLAGNEDNRRTCNDGTRLQESAKINQSLFALSNVIYALNNNDSHIPYRESKLTRILQDSLGGTSQALMIACLNPSAYQEAVHTVSLAARSRHVLNYVGPASKETPKEKVDMELKLRAWLESKGKTRSIRRMNGVFSPPNGKGCSSVRDLEKSGWSSAKAKVTGCDMPNAKGRNLFDSAAKLSVHKETTGPCKKQVAPMHNRIHEEGSKTSKDDMFCQAVQHREKLQNFEMTKHGEDEYSTVQNNASVNLNFSNANSDTEHCCPSNLSSVHVTSDGGEGKDPYHAENSKTSENPGNPCNKENILNPADSFYSSPIDEKLHDLQRSFRKVLSLIPENVTPTKDPLSKDRLCVLLFESKTPKTPHEKGKTDMTEHDKFDILSSNLKESVINGYLSFLNVASKEELLQLKGIGPKRAEHILQLRQQTPKPLKSLSDLEKIGLSSKQVHGMFRKAARGILT